jgi:hypothetical protein
MSSESLRGVLPVDASSTGVLVAMEVISRRKEANKAGLLSPPVLGRSEGAVDQYENL